MAEKTLILPAPVVPQLPTKYAIDAPISSWSEWHDVNLVRAAVRSLELGHFDMASQVIDAMGRDDRISGIRGTRSGTLPALPLTMTPSKKGDGRRKKMVAAELEELFPKMYPDYALTELADWGVMAGIGIGQNLWSFGAQRWTPTFKVWHPRFVFYRWDTRSYWVGTMDGAREVIPGNGEWVVYAPWGLNRAWMYGKVRALFVPWLLRQFAMRDWGRYNEVHGNPIRKAVTPAASQKDDEKRFIRQVANLGNEMTINTKRTSPNSEWDRYDVELLEALGKSDESFDKIIALANTCIAINLLGQNLSTEVKGGSYAATIGHLQIRNDVLQGDAQNLGACIREQGLGPYCHINFGDAELSPMPTWKTKPPDDKVQKGVALKNLGDGIFALKKVGAKVDVDKMLEDDEVPTTGPSEDVDVNALENPAPAATDEEQPQPGVKKLPRPKVAASKASDVPDALVEGQLYVDELVEASVPAGRKALGPDVDAVLEAISAADSYEDLRARLVKAYKGMSRKKLAQLLKNAMQLADLSGRWAVTEEAKEE